MRSRTGIHAAAPTLGPVFRAAAGILALLALVAGGWLALHYPIATPAMPIGFAAVALLAGAFPSAWLVLVPALLPIIGFAPYSGWLTFEEFDLLVLAVAAGGYARLGLGIAQGRQAASTQTDSRQRRGRRRSSVSVLVWLMLLSFGAALLIALQRGFADAGGFDFGWFQGYLEPMNSLRIGKSFLLAMLLLPLWLASARERRQLTERCLVAGLTAGLLVAALATIRERLAFTGLLNFSSDYRTTGLFWEMHVGGAALDGFLALTMPFALQALLWSRSAPTFAGAALALALGVYSCLTTFSRGVYLAVPIALLIVLALWWRAQSHRPEAGSAEGSRDWHVGSAVVLVVGFSAALANVFPTGGYRSLFAVLGTIAAWLAVAPSLRGLRGKHWVLALGGGGLLSALAVPMAYVLPKGPYLVFAAAVSAVLAMAGAQWLQPRIRLPAVASPTTVWQLASLVAACAAMALVADHWGGAAALHDALAVVGGLLVLTITCALFGRPVVATSPRWRAAVFGATLATALVVAAIGGGSYMSGRFATGGKDLDDRFTHWREGLSMLSSTADWTFGKGLGRFPANSYFSRSRVDHPGDYRLLA